MAFITPEETPANAVEQYDVDQPIIPRRIGFCSNPIDLYHWCGADVFDDDIDAVELPQIGRRRQFCCGSCVERLLSVKPPIDLDDKIVKKKKYRPGINGNGGVPKAKQQKYVEDYEL